MNIILDKGVCFGELKPGDVFVRRDDSSMITLIKAEVSAWHGTANAYSIRNGGAYSLKSDCKCIRRSAEIVISDL
jgi:hypothetical protein